MLSKEQNERLTRIGPGTPCGELMRRYWHPVAATVDLLKNPVKKVKILGEELVLYQDRSGTLGLLGPQCAHRMVHLEWGIPEECGLRCPYHGWLYNAQGACIEQPLEPPTSTFKDKITTTAYPVREMGGLVWAYLGPEPVPLLPKWDLFDRNDGFRQIMGNMLPCNWLQATENGGDPGHGTFLHGRFFQYIMEREGTPSDDPRHRGNAAMRDHEDRLARGVYIRYRPVMTQYGLTKGVLDSDKTGEGDPAWEDGVSPVIFPYLRNPERGLGIRRVYQMAVPIDDENTWHISYHCYMFPPQAEVPKQDGIPYVDVPIKDETGRYIQNYVLGQDMVAFYSQGQITDRTREHLASSDACIIAYRQMLEEQIALVEQGGTPMNVFSDAPDSPRIDPSPVKWADKADSTYYRGNYQLGKTRSYIEDDVDRYCPDKDLIKELYRRTADIQASGLLKEAPVEQTVPHE